MQAVASCPTPLSVTGATEGKEPIMKCTFHGPQIESCLRDQIDLCNGTARAYHTTVNNLLDRQLEHAVRHVPYYRDRVGLGAINGGASPQEKLSCFPFLTRTDLQRHRSALLAEGLPPSEILERSSSGSSGTPATVLKDKSLFEFYAAVLVHKMITHGWTPFDTYFLMHGAGIGNIRPGLQVEELRDLLYAGKPDILYCYPSYLLSLLDVMSPLECDDMGLKFIGTHSETSSQAERDYLSKRFRCPVYDDYGATEVGPIASQCRLGRYHVVEHNVHVEILRQDGSRAAEGCLGEVVVTDVRNRVMPLIRYRTGDYAVVSETCECSCGWKNMRQIASVEGRVEDSFILPTGRVVPPGQLIGPLGFSGGDAVRQWELIQKTRNRFLLRVVKGPGFRETEVEKFLDKFMSVVGEPVVVVPEYVDSITVDISGKRRVYRSEARG